MSDLHKDFTVHPRKNMGRTPRFDYNGDPMPKTLEQVYGSWSDAKQSAYNYCVNLCRKYDGTRFCILSHNTMTFTVGFDFMNPDTGELMRAIITKSYNHAYFV